MTKKKPYLIHPVSIVLGSRDNLGTLPSKLWTQRWQTLLCICLLWWKPGYAEQFSLAVLGITMSVFSAAGAWLQISPSLANLPRTRLNPLLSQGLSPCLCCYLAFSFRGRDEDCFVFFFSFFSSPLLPKGSLHQALFRSALLNGPNTSKHYSPSPHGGPSSAMLKSQSCLCCHKPSCGPACFCVRTVGIRGAFLDKNDENAVDGPHGACLSLCTSRLFFVSTSLPTSLKTAVCPQETLPVTKMRV